VSTHLSIFPPPGAQLTDETQSQIEESLFANPVSTLVRLAQSIEITMSRLREAYRFHEADQLARQAESLRQLSQKFWEDQTTKRA
jgi:hypothetical protein